MVDSVLEWAIREYGDGFAIATSFQKEGMAIIDMACRVAEGVRVFTIDTGRLPEETYRMIDVVRRRYPVRMEVVMPDHEEVERMVALNGSNLFYGSAEARRLCCEVRKVRPLERKLRGLRAWATGLRRGQSETRAEVAKIEWVDGRIKINPLADWSAAEVEDYIRDYDVPVHPLYALGYASIGCAPCTRPVLPGESARAGRWWWEEDSKKECGIHFSALGRAALRLRRSGPASRA